MSSLWILFNYFFRLICFSWLVAGPCSRGASEIRCLAPVKQHMQLLLLKHTCISCQHT